MARTLVCKLLQRRTYDFLSQKYTVFALFVGVVVIIVSALHFGETMIEWSREKYAAVFYPFSNNLAGKNFQKMLCQHVPIDVVYTWVNGTDPDHLKGLSATKRDYGFYPFYTNSCMLSFCIESHMVLVTPDLPRTVTLDDLEEIHPLYKNVQESFVVSSPYSSHGNTTVLVFNSVLNAAQAAQRKLLPYDGRNYTVNQAFMTDNWLSYGTVSLKNTFLVLGLPANHTEQTTMDLLPADVKNFVLKIIMHPSKRHAIVTLSKSDGMDHMLSVTNSTSFRTNDDKELAIVPSNLVIEHPSEHEDVSASRFTDNEELRYSLRSLEKHAPWVQHVYIITNGQIPYWLNLDSSRVSVITHEELFPNKSHLPTFSSPAIECHLHRIPNLSEKFLYLNDDVMFGKDVWPEDFFTHTRGQKVYLSWPVPNCAEGCPASWIRDGYCDKPCNNSFCQWDGGDCTADNPLLSYQGVVIHPDGSTNIFHSASKADSCHEDCVNTWLADRYCDKACNIQDCAFDAGDCGVDRYNQLFQLELTDNVNDYHFLEGEQVGFVNLTKFIHINHTITEGFYDNHAVVRMLAISLKYSVLTILLNPHFNTTRLAITLKGRKSYSPFEKVFYLTVNTELKPHTPKPTVRELTTESPILFEMFPEEMKKPGIVTISDNLDEKYSKVDVIASNLPNNTVAKIEQLNQKVQEGELTEKGYWRSKCIIISEYVIHFQTEYHQMPLLVYDLDLDFKSIFEIEASSLSKPVSTLPPKVPRVKPAPKPISRNLQSGTFLDGQVVDQPSPSFLQFWDSFHVHRMRTLKAMNQFLYDTPSVKHRNLLDTFGDSLRHVNKLYNEAFGYDARKVPSHIAHFVDKNVMARLYERFSDAFDVTSSHKVRRSNDMQFAFSYYYYMMSEMETVGLREIFDTFDVDHSGTWSDREIRTVLARLHDLPLELSEMNEFQQYIVNCSYTSSRESGMTTGIDEHYYETSLPVVSKALVLSCHQITGLLKQQFGQRKRNHFEVVGEDEVAFKMIHNNLTHVLSQIDDIRKHPKKFVCLNDNMKHGTPEAELIRSVIQDFYESLFPVRSQFELPPDYRNRFLYMDELQQWRKMRDIIRFATYFSLGLLILFTVTSFWKTEVRVKRNRHRSGGRATERTCQV